MRIVGLTGSFGVGKSFVAQCFKDLGAKIIDADNIVHDLLKKNKALIRDIQKVFPSVVNKGVIDRVKLADIIFNNDRSRRKLEQLIHPRAKKEVEQQLNAHKKKKASLVIIDAPLIVEAKWNMHDILIVVKANQALQIQRIQKRMSLTRSQILKRIHAQLSTRAKSKHADYIIDNRTTQARTKQQVRAIYKDIVQGKH